MRSKFGHLSSQMKLQPPGYYNCRKSQPASKRISVNSCRVNLSHSPAVNYCWLRMEPKQLPINSQSLKFSLDMGLGVQVSSRRVDLRNKLPRSSLTLALLGVGGQKGEHVVQKRCNKSYFFQYSHCGWTRW